MHVVVSRAFDQIEKAEEKLKEAQKRFEDLRNHGHLGPLERFVLSSFEVTPDRTVYGLRLKVFEELDRTLRDQKDRTLAVVCEATELVGEGRPSGCMTPGIPNMYHGRLDVYTGTLSGGGLDFGESELLFGDDLIKRYFGERVPSVIFPTIGKHTHITNQGITTNPGDFCLLSRREPVSEESRGRPKIGLMYLPHLVNAPKKTNKFLWPYASQILIGKEAQDYIGKITHPLFAETPKVQ